MPIRVSTLKTMTSSYLIFPPVNDHAPSDKYREIAEIVASILRRERWGEEKLYALLVQCLRSRFRMQLGQQEMEDHLHDVYMVVLTAIRNGSLRDAYRLSGYIRTIGARARVSKVQEIVWNREHFVPSDEWRAADRRDQPDDALYNQQKLEMTISALNSLRHRDREILTRFYLLNQTPEEIMAALELTATQFRLCKSRAKQIIIERVRAQLDGTKSEDSRLRKMLDQ